jgi:uncharacterized membrane protein
MRRLAPYRGPLITFTVVGTMMAFLVGWLETGKLLAGVATAAVIVVALGVGFALYARVLASAPPSLSRAQSDVRRDRDES